MSKATLARKLATEFGVSVSKASRFIDDVGGTTARRLLDDAGRSASKWSKRLFGGSVLAGSGGLAWRQQEVWKAEALAEQANNRQEAIQSIIESDLPADMKRQLILDLDSNSSNGTSGDDEDDDDSGLPDLGDLFGDLEDVLGDAQTTLALIVVIAILLKFGGD